MVAGIWLSLVVGPLFSIIVSESQTSGDTSRHLRLSRRARVILIRTVVLEKPKSNDGNSQGYNVPSQRTQTQSFSCVPASDAD
jgi:hypothetical protein